MIGDVPAEFSNILWRSVDQNVICTHLLLSIPVSYFFQFNFIITNRKMINKLLLTYYCCEIGFVKMATTNANRTRSPTALWEN